mgnify:CR=1 FL=1
MAGTESAYRLLLADMMPFGKNARIQLEHGATNESTEHYETVTYWYGLPGASIVQAGVGMHSLVGHARRAVAPVEVGRGGDGAELGGRTVRQYLEADQDRGDAAGLGDMDQGIGDRANLGDAAGHREPVDRPQHQHGHHRHQQIAEDRKSVV